MCACIAGGYIFFFICTVGSSTNLVDHSFTRFVCLGYVKSAHYWNLVNCKKESVKWDKMNMTSHT